jgi:hypothetical protein
MNAKKHLILFLVGFFGWLFFFLLGYPSNYFTEWSLAGKIMLSLITFFAVVPFLGCLVLIFLKGNYLQTAFWMAFYASIPVFIFDFIVVGIVQDHGLSFLKSHWYITIAYFYVWIDLPLIGLALQKLTNAQLNHR